MAEPATGAVAADPQAEIARLHKIIRALMNRAEHSTDIHGSDFTLFQTAVMLEEQVRGRTAELQEALAERDKASSALRKSEARFAAIFDMTPDPFALTRLADGKILMVSRSYAEYFGYRPEAIIGRSTLPGDLNIWNDLAERQQWKQALEATGELLGFQSRLRAKDGTIATVMISGRIVDFDGEQCVIIHFQDISEQTRHAEYLEQVASHDPLTGLPNRLLMNDRLAHAIARNGRGGTSVAVCYLDLDGFKAVNDGFGHDAGDRVLIEVARRLRFCVRSGDTVARLGGDEFVVLLSDLVDEGECRIALDRMLRAVAAPYHLDGEEQSGVSASIGVTVYPNDDSDPDSLVRHADQAMYAAKQAGKNRYQMFDTRLELRLEARLATLRELAAALAAEQFCLVYQPKVDCRQGRVVGVEALLRWRHPTLGLLSPDEFVPLVEDTDLAVDIGQWTLRAVLVQMVAWQSAGIDLPVSVNAFTRHLLQPGFAAQLRALCEEFSGAGYGRLQIEIAETAALKELKAVREVMVACQAFEVGFALDDFGTGYSTLSHLRHLPAQEIKIDQSFVAHMIDRPEDRSIVVAVIGLAKAFDRAVVAVGAETRRHVVDLLAMGCDEVQGYALARPMVAADVPDWLAAFHPDGAWWRPDGADRELRG